MPRAANAYKKSGPAIAPGDEQNDTGAAAQQKVRIVSASGLPPVETTAPASIFAAGQAAKPAPMQRAPRQMLDIETIKIKKDVPLPETDRGAAGFYAQLWARIPVGGMVELPRRQAAGLHSYAKKLGTGRVAIRTLDTGVKGVWRLV